jgi:hypothetical protein
MVIGLLLSRKYIEDNGYFLPIPEPHWWQNVIVMASSAPYFANYIQSCTRPTAASDKVYQLLAHGRWLSLGTPASSTTKTGRHDIAEILLKVALNTINKI